MKHFICEILFFLLYTGMSQAIHGGFTINDNLYTVHWDTHHHFITFRIIARGTGFVGFGLSPTGTMEGADLFIAGINDENGTVYAIDANGASATKDAMSNSQLLYIHQGPMHTEVHFRRALNTGDCKEDIPIMNENQYVIWSIGPPMDKLEHHGPMNRGKVLVNLLNPPMFHSYYRTDMNSTRPPCMDMGMGMGGGGEKPMEPAADATPAPVASEDAAAE